MDQGDIAKAGESLRVLLDRYASENSEAEELRRALLPLLDRARRSQITSPLSWSDIPGAYFFTEGSLCNYPDLQDALAKFKLQITGIGERAAKIMSGIPRPRS